MPSACRDSGPGGNRFRGLRPDWGGGSIVLTEFRFPHPFEKLATAARAYDSKAERAGRRVPGWGLSVSPPSQSVSSRFNERPYLKNKVK